MASFSWNATTGGDWNTASDWTPTGVPGASDTAMFATGGNAYDVTGDATVGQILVSGDDVTLDGQVLTGTAGQSGLTGENGATVDIGGNALVDDSGSLTLDASSLLEVDGTLITSGSSVGTAQVSGFDGNWTDAATVSIAQLYVNTLGSFSGNVDLADGGAITLDTSATFGGGTVTLQGSGTIYVANAPGDSAGTFGFSDAIVTSATAGDGVILASDPGATLDVSGAISGSGLVVVNGGNVSLAAGNTYTGDTVVDAATLTLNGVGAAGAGVVFLSDGATLNTLADSTGAAGGETVVTGGADTVNASAGALLVFGSASTLSFQGGASASTVVGGAGALTATGGSAGDVLFGGSSGQDVLSAGTGDTTLVGGTGGVLNAVGAGNDVLVATAGNTTLSGGVSTGTDLYFTSGTGTTVVQAGAGATTVVADGAANDIYGAASQTIFLGSGVNQLDFLPGESGTDAVIGFTSADQIVLTGFGPDEAQNAVNNAVVTGGSTILTLSDNTQITLYGYTGVTSATFT